MPRQPQRRRALHVGAITFDEYEGVERVGIEPVLHQQLAADGGLQRAETNARRALMVEHEPHRAVAQVADAVEEQDRRAGYHGLMA